MLADPDGILERATGPDGLSRRFYPPGQHPATHSYREHLFQLERLRDRIRDDAGYGASVCTTDLDAAIEHDRQAIARHEHLEDVDKCRYLLAHHEREALGAREALGGRA